MYLSRIELDAKSRSTMAALASPSKMHGYIENSFSGERLRNLWRVDNLGDKTYLLILSRTEGDFTELTKEIGYNKRWETKNYDRFLERLETGQRCRFRLCANAVRSEPHSEGAKRGKIHAHVTQEQQKQWLLKRAESCGFVLSADEFDVTCTDWKTFYKSGQRITLRMAEFEGLMTILDADRLKAVLVTGIGRAKAYGCGLLTVAGC